MKKSMTEETGKERLIKMRLAARYLTESLLLAYWDERRFDYHMGAAQKEWEKLMSFAQPSDLAKDMRQEGLAA